MKGRIDRLRLILRRNRLDAILVSNPSNIYYLSGFRGTDSYSLITILENFIITDFRFTEQAQREAVGFEVVSRGTNLFKNTAQLIKRLSLKKIGFESHHLTVKETQVIGEVLGKRLYPTFQLIEKLRIIKEAAEIASIKKAAGITKTVLKKAIQEIRRGNREKEIALKIDFLLRKKGAESVAFPTIVASGPNASMPHARPTQRKVRDAEPVIIDCGARFNGYNSDLTRTHIVGKICQYFKFIYSIVASAQAKAIDKVRPGAKISEVDKAARGYITRKGFGKYFGHATGHCIGIDIHELPSINANNHTILKEGMVFSVEPAIYIPSWGGVRIEDTVLVTAKGHAVLTR